MSTSHATGWRSGEPTAAQMKEFYEQIASGRITGSLVQGLIRGSPKPSNVFVSGKYPVTVYSGRTAIAFHRKQCGPEVKIDSSITDANYPQGDVGPGLESRKQSIRLLYFGRNISTREVLEWARPHAYEAVGAASMLALSAAYPALKRYRIVGLGQFANIVQPNHTEKICAVVLQNERGKREAWTMPEHVWLDDDPDVYFAVEEFKRLA